jgi:glycerophosphoryl diester phosphodiesterase
MSVTTESALQLVAHRGNAYEFPENTLPALRSALELGVSFVEFDVHLSADGMPVVMHDANLMRCAGIDRDALEMNWDELQDVPVGEAQRFGDRFVDVCIPSLTQVAELLGNFPKAAAFVELKRASLHKFGMEQVVRSVCSALKPVAAQVVLISFDLPAVHYIKQNSGLKVGWVLSEYNSLSLLKAEATLPHYLFCDHLKLPADASRLWRGPWRWALYEVTTRAEAAELQTRGVQLVESMQVRHMLRELRTLRAQAGN